jgi:predicted ABC-type ATPase
MGWSDLSCQGGYGPLEVIIVAGPNGSGKTTFIREYLKQNPYPYLSADAIAEGMTAKVEDVRIKAGRSFIRGIEAQIEIGHSFILESTLSGLTFRRMIALLKQSGYEISIIFLFLRSADACVARVVERVRKGGHLVPEADIRRRYTRSIMTFWQVYRLQVDRWYVYYNGGIHFHEVALGEADVVEVRDEEVFAHFLSIAEEETR